jgi:hypothetical protein
MLGMPVMFALSQEGELYKIDKNPLRQYLDGAFYCG